MEDVNLFFNRSDKGLEPLPPAVLSSALLAVVNAAKVNSLKSISLNTNFSYYLHWLIVQIITGLKADNSYDSKLYDCLKRLEISSVESLECSPSGKAEDLVQLISHQKGMETLSLFPQLFCRLYYWLL